MNSLRGNRALVADPEVCPCWPIITGTPPDTDPSFSPNIDAFGIIFHSNYINLDLADARSSYIIYPQDYSTKYWSPGATCASDKTGLDVYRPSNNEYHFCQAQLLDKIKQVFGICEPEPTETVPCPC